MCSRFYRAELSWQTLTDKTGVSPIPGVEPPPAHWNAAPGVHHPIIRTGARPGERELAPCHWGLVPSWWTKPISQRSFSGIFTPADTARERAVYRGAFRYRRCLVPVSGFYIWSGDGRQRTPFAVGPNLPGDWFCLAGLWDRALIDGSVIESFCVLTCSPNDTLAGLVTHMPVILDESLYGRWLDPNSGATDDILISGPSEAIAVWPAHPEVGNVRHNFPALVNRPN